MNQLHHDIENIAESICTILYDVKKQSEDFYRWTISADKNMHIIFRAVPDIDNYSLVAVARQHILEGSDRSDFQEYLLNQIALWRFSTLCTSWITEDGLDAFGLKFFCYEYSKQFVENKIQFLDSIVMQYLEPDDETDHLDSMLVKRLGEKWVSI